MKLYESVSFDIADYNNNRQDLMNDVATMQQILLKNGYQIHLYDDDGNGNVIVLDFALKDPKFGIGLEWIDLDQEYDGYLTF